MIVLNAVSDTRKEMRIRFAVSGAVSMAADTALFVLLVRFAISRKTRLRVAVAALAARFLSSQLNYQLGSRWVFGRRSPKTAKRYFSLCACRFICSCALMEILAFGFDFSLIPSKLAADALMGLGSFKVQSAIVFRRNEPELDFYGGFARAAQMLLCGLSKKYSSDIVPDGKPVVYVCRHLDMHGPYTTIKWLPFDVHPLVLSVYFDRHEGYDHMRSYTFSKRWGKKPKKFSGLSWLVSGAAYRAFHSLKAVPVFRGGNGSIKTLRGGLKYLKKGESLIVFPDIDYTGKYGRESEIYEGFLYYGEMYRRSTGESLRFVPLYIDEHSRTITAGKAVTADERADIDKAAEELKAAINGRQIFAA